MTTAFDAGIPLSPIWIVLYVMIYPAAILPMFVVKDPLVFRNVIKLPGGGTHRHCYFVIVPVHMSLTAIEAVPEGGFFEWGSHLLLA